MKTMNGIVTAAILALLSISSSAFTYPSTVKSISSKTHSIVHASKYDDMEQKVGIAAVAAVFVFSNALFPEEALAAGRSGGRGGGRASVTSSSRVVNSAARTTIINPGPTVIAAPPVYVAPPVVVAPSPFGYNPMGGLGE